MSKYEIGDKVRIKKSCIKNIIQTALDDIKNLNTNGVFTIKSGREGTFYYTKEFGSRWMFNEGDLELFYDINEKIKNRFEILDL